MQLQQPLMMKTQQPLTLLPQQHPRSMAGLTMLPQQHHRSMAGLSIADSLRTNPCRQRAVPRRPTSPCCM